MTLIVIPAKAGIPRRHKCRRLFLHEIPAFAGMTRFA
jgi:hypothetical protein